MRDENTDGTLSRLSVAIDVARICTMFLIVTGHCMQLKGFYAHFTGGAGYPFQQDDYQKFMGSLASQPWSVDKIFLVLNFSYWSLNFTFFALSGLSLWLSCRVKNTFTLGTYFSGRFISVYLGYALAVIVAFIVAIVFLDHTPGEHDLNYLLLGVARARETVFYNDTLWFMSVLFVLYLLYPAIPFLYAKTKYVGIVALWAAALYFFYVKHSLANISFIPIAFFFFMTGILAAEIFVSLQKAFKKRNSIFLASLVALAAYCSWKLYGVLYGDIVLSGKFEYSTHATGLLFFIIFITIGMQFPRLKSGFLRKAGTATYTMYLFHYLFVRLYNNNQKFYDTFSKLGDVSPWPLQESIFAASAVLFLLLMGVAMLYDKVIIGPLISTTKRMINKEIILTKALTAPTKPT